MSDSKVIKMSLCPHCGHHLDRASDLAGGDGSVRPKPGDFTFCLYCGEPAKFGEDMGLEKLTDEETGMIDPNVRSRAKLASLMLKALKDLEPTRKPTIQ